MRSFWLDEVLQREGEDNRTEPLTGDRRVDVCIVGGGYTGLWTALRLKELEPGLDVAIVEADICGGGASGRNSGFVMNWAHKAPILFKLCGAQEGLRLLRESEAAVKSIGDFCAHHGLDAGFRLDGWIWTASNQAQIGGLSSIVNELDRLGIHPFEQLSPEEVARRTGSNRNVAGIFEPGVATVNPAVLVRGLRRIALENGVRIYEDTPMRSLDRARPSRVHTPGGTITADSVVLALETWAAELPEFRRAFMVVSADGIMTEAVPHLLAEAGVTNGVAISDSRLFLNVFRTTVDGRLHYATSTGVVPFAGRVGRRFDGQTPIQDELETELRRFYPSLSAARIVSGWRGSVTRTRMGLPFFGRLPGHPNIVFAHGYSGSGVGPSHMAGRVLASLVLGRKDEWSETPFSHGPLSAFPPEPIRYFGSWLVRGAVARKERAEDQGRKPNRLDATLSRLAPASLDARTKE